MTGVTTRGEKCLSEWFKSGPLNGGHKAVLRVVAVLHLGVARETQVEVIAGSAGNKFLLRVLYINR